MTEHNPPGGRSPKPPRIPPADKQPLEVVCGECRHVWVLAWLPMDIWKLARIMRGSTCPRCASTEVHLMSPGRPPAPPKPPPNS